MSEITSPWDLVGVQAEPEEPEIDAEPLTTAEELELWTQRAHHLWTSALANGDTRTMAQAVTIALRNLKTRIDREQASREALFDPATQELTEAQRRLFVRFLDGVPQQHLEAKTQ